jgi:hypothetical protein
MLLTSVLLAPIAKKNQIWRTGTNKGEPLEMSRKEAKPLEVGTTQSAKACTPTQ